jgi:hypothetical protein
MAFAPGSVTAFRYEAVRFDPATGIAEFDYALMGPGVDERFTERLVFTVRESPARDRLDRVLALLGAVLGLSYYKAAAPPRIEIAARGITPAAVRYLRLVIREGLAEFAYRVGLPGPLEPEIAVAELARPPASVLRVEGTPLVPIGGGKDSVVTVESLAAVGLEPVQFAVQPNEIVRRVAAASGRPLVAVGRELDLLILRLNGEGALNGHVPVTAMNTLAGVVQSLLLGLGPVVMSNESSASDPTLDWDGHPVNHQWSKSLEAERALSTALRDHAGLEGASFSFLRPFSELRIARAYGRLEGYDEAIVSCNRAFRRRDATPGWCGECDKCRFVFLAFSPYLEPVRLVRMIGRDMFADSAQLPGYRTLVGLGAHKPFECVGEEAESSVAVTLASRVPRWAETAVIQGLVQEAPAFAVGDPEVERRVLGEGEADPVPAHYEEARRALL